VTGFSRDARASDVDLGTALAVLDSIFTIHDVINIAAERRTHPALAVAEIVVTTPQVVWMGAWTAVTTKAGGYPEPTAAVLFAWTSALLVHGVISLAADASEAPERPSEPAPDHPRIGIAPTWFGEGTQAKMPGVVVVGTF
jgi:hypothetical protein